MLDEARETIEEGRLAKRESAFGQRFATAQAAQIAIDAGTRSPWVDALLTRLGHEVLVANPRRLRMIGELTADAIPAEATREWLLADLCRFDADLRLPGPRSERLNGSHAQRHDASLAEM